MAPGKFQGSSRGIFGLQTWEIPRMPFSEKKPNGKKKVPQKPVINLAKDPNLNSDEKSGQELMAKYSYKANPSSPLGPELSLNAGDKLNFVNKHESQEMWWLVRDSEGRLGYVPASYVIKYDELVKVKSMPWLDAKSVGTEENNNGEKRNCYKKYVSSYEREEMKQMKLKEYYCKICEKQLNGPQPYRAHIFSKSHKEIEEYYKETNK